MSSDFYSNTFPENSKKILNRSIGPSRPRWCCGKPRRCGFLRSNTLSLAKCIRSRNHKAGAVFAEFVGYCRLAEGER